MWKSLYIRIAEKGHYFIAGTVMTPIPVIENMTDGVVIEGVEVVGVVEEWEGSVIGLQVRKLVKFLLDYLICWHSHNLEQMKALKCTKVKNL